jgi:hypothetical protein
VPVVNRQAALGGEDPRAQIYGQDPIPEPPRLSTFKRRGGGGGGPESSTHLSDGYDQSAQINDAQEIPDPHCLSTFNKGGGGPESGASSQWPRSKRPDQRRTGDPTLLSRSAFNQCGAFPRRVTSRAASPLLPIFHFTS